MDLIDLALKHLKSNPPLLEDARRGEPTLLGSLISMLGFPRRRAEHAVREALERIDGQA